MESPPLSAANTEDPSATPLDITLMESPPLSAANTEDPSATPLAPAPGTRVEFNDLHTEPETPDRAPDARLQPSAVVELQFGSLPLPFDQLQTPPLNSAQKGLKVYSRRRPRMATSYANHVSPAPSGVASFLVAVEVASQQMEDQIPPPQQPPSTGCRDVVEITPLDLFFSNLVSKVSSILPVPNTTRQRTEPAPPRPTPRRSRRIAGAGVELPMGEAGNESVEDY
jgi:hypothetical protein